MSSNSKRQATSPAEKIPQNKKPMSLSTQPSVPAAASKPVDPSKGSLIKIEVVAINDKVFYGTLSEVELVYIWEKILGRSKDEIFAMSYNRTLLRNFKVTFKLNFKAEPSEIYPEPTFVYHRKRPGTDDDDEDDFDVILCKFVGYDTVKPAEIGKLTRITVKTNDFSVEPESIIPWLAKFGSVSNHHDYEKNSVGLRTDVLETEIVLMRHIPEFLPIAGRKLQVSYPGIPKGCNNCYKTGHLKRNCKEKKVEWLDRVAGFKATGEFEDELFGGWIALLESQKRA